MTAVTAICMALVGCSPEDVQPPPLMPVSESQLEQRHRLSFARAHGYLKAGERDGLIQHGVYSDPCVLREGNRYRMWFTAAANAFRDNQVLGTTYAESDDGTNWTPRKAKASEDPELILRPTPSGWDSEGIETPAVVRTPQGEYLLFYTGSRPPKGSHTWSIGLAVSPDGITWRKHGPGPVLGGQGGWEGPFHEGEGNERRVVGGVQEPSVLYDRNTAEFKMWYSALGIKDGKTAFRIGFATSKDGRAWARREEPVLEPGPDGAWDDAVVSHVNVIADPADGYHLFYFGTSAKDFQYGESVGAAMIPGAIGHAYSRDGVVWMRDANPILNRIPNSPEAWMIGGPSALVENGQIRLWYFASGAHDKFEFKMRLAIAELRGRSP